MKTARLVFIVLLLLSSLGVFAQGAYLEKGVNGFGGETRVIWTQDGFEGVEVVAGYSIAGALDIGVDFGYTLGELAGSDSSELGIAFDYKVNVVKQSTRVPLSLQIMGSYGIANVSSDYLDTNEWIRRGTGYTIGLSLARNFRLASFWLVRMNLLVDYESFLYTDSEKTGAPGPPPSPPAIVNQELIGNLFLGGGLGVLFVFPRGSTLALQAEVRADQDLELQIHPILAVAFPQK